LSGIASTSPSTRHGCAQISWCQSYTPAGRRDSPSLPRHPCPRLAKGAEALRGTCCRIVGSPPSHAVLTCRRPTKCRRLLPLEPAQSPHRIRNLEARLLIIGGWECSHSPISACKRIASAHVAEVRPARFSRVFVANSSDADALSTGVTRPSIVEKVAMGELRLGQLTELRRL
jgi:hypothetical protein